MFKGVWFVTLHAFTITDNSIAFKFFFGDENTVQKFECNMFFSEKRTMKAEPTEKYRQKK